MNNVVLRTLACALNSAIIEASSNAKSVTITLLKELKDNEGNCLYKCACANLPEHYEIHENCEITSVELDMDATPIANIDTDAVILNCVDGVRYVDFRDIMSAVVGKHVIELSPFVLENSGDEWDMKAAAKRVNDYFNSCAYTVVPDIKH